MSGRSAQAKGRRAEIELARFLQEHGLKYPDGMSRPQPMPNGCRTGNPPLFTGRTADNG